MTVTTETPEARDARITAKYEAGVMSGRAFALVAQSAGSIIGYQPPTSASSYAAALRVLARGAALGDRQARLVSAIIGRVPIHNTPGDTVRLMYTAAAEALGHGYFDTVGNASPEPGRRSDHEHEYTLRDRMLLMHTLHHAARKFLPNTGHGWCYCALVKRERLSLLDFDRAS